MHRIMLKSKLTNVTVTATKLHYDGSITIAEDLLQAADIVPGEQVHVLNLHNGSRLITYAIVAPARSGVIVLNGPAARRGQPGDSLTILAYGYAVDTEAIPSARIVNVAPGNQLPRE